MLTTSAILKFSESLPEITEDTPVAPESVNPQMQKLLDNTACLHKLIASLYDTYSSLKTYRKGDVVLYDWTLWSANQDIDPAEEWTAEHWDKMNTARAIFEALYGMVSGTTTIENTSDTVKTITTENTSVTSTTTVTKESDAVKKIITEISMAGDTTKYIKTTTITKTDTGSTIEYSYTKE